MHPKLTFSKKSKSDKIPVYRFQKDEMQKEKWIKATPNTNLRVVKDTVVCALHQISHFEEIKINGKSRPKDLPSIWPGVYGHLVKYRHRCHPHEPQ